MNGRRQSSRVAADRIRAQLASDEENVESIPTRSVPIAAAGRASLKRRVLSIGEHASAQGQQQPSPTPPTHVDKRPRTVKRSRSGPKNKSSLAERLLGGLGEHQVYDCKLGPGRAPATRLHSTLYHRPLLLLGETGRRGRASLLEWYDGVSEERLMPWRKPFNPEHHGPAAESRAALSVRAYEVWISEIMLQQTRVAVVKDYWTRWMKRWPTMADLAAAHEDEVMGAWRGLGCLHADSHGPTDYSRARRILDAAKKVAQDPVRRGLLPQTAKELEDEMPGVGRYTAGAISAIAFGNADCMVDGNVLRVLSRQLGVFGDVKSDKAVIDLLWAAAQALVEAATSERSGVDEETGRASPSDVPGRWGQALMELGSTVCTPQPNCVACPINFTCRAYEEGRTVAGMKGLARDEPRDATGLVDMEDVCSLCSDWNAESSEDVTDAADGAGAGQAAGGRSKRRTKRSEQAAGTSSPPRSAQHEHGYALSPEAVGAAISHARKFPVRVSKKAVREEETVVCAVRRTSDGCYLIQKRPEKGLLAGLWELPSHVLSVAEGGHTAASRRQTAQEFVAGLFGPKDGHGTASIKYAGDLGSVPWVFSHLKLTMHVHSFQIEDGAGDVVVLADRARWATATGVEEETMGTGMRHCWKRVVAPQ